MNKIREPFKRLRKIVTFPQNFVIFVTGRPGNDGDCATPVLQSGCNIINNQCTCETVRTCRADAPFGFSSRDECELNLAVMLAHELLDVPSSGKLLTQFKGSGSKWNLLMLLYNAQLRVRGTRYGIGKPVDCFSAHYQRKN